MPTASNQKTRHATHVGSEPTTEPTQSRQPSRTPVEPYEPEVLPDNDNGKIIGGVIGGIFALLIISLAVVIWMSGRNSSGSGKSDKYSQVASRET